MIQRQNKKSLLICLLLVIAAMLAVRCGNLFDKKKSDSAASNPAIPSDWEGTADYSSTTWQFQDP